MTNVITEYTNILTKAEITPELDVTRIHELAEKARGIQDVDIWNDEQMGEVKTMQKELQKARTAIKKDALAAREQFNAASKAVIEIEKSVLSIFVGEEDRLKGYLEERKQKEVIKQREEDLPKRRSLLSTLNDGVEVDDAQLLLMDDSQFLDYVTERQTAKAEADRIAKEALEAEDRRKAEEAARIKEAQERVRREAEAQLLAEAERVQREKQEELAQIEREREAERRKAEEEARAKQAEIDRLQREKEERERKEAAAIVEAEKEKARLAAQEKYQSWLKEEGFNPETDRLEDTGEEVVLYRRISSYKK